MKIMAGSRLYDVQNDKVCGFVVTNNGRVISRGTRGYEMAVSEFKRIEEDAAYAAREVAMTNVALAEAELRDRQR